MKNIFTESELKCGMFLIRNDASRPFKNVGFATTVVFKVGFEMNPKDDKKYGLISVLTDGRYCPIAKDLKELAEYLNKDERGYRPITKDEFIELLNSSNQGFY